MAGWVGQLASGTAGAASCQTGLSSRAGMVSSEENVSSTEPMHSTCTLANLACQF